MIVNIQEQKPEDYQQKASYQSYYWSTYIDIYNINNKDIYTKPVP